MPTKATWKTTQGLSINAKLDSLSLNFYDYQGRNVFDVLYMEKACNALHLNISSG